MKSPMCLILVLCLFAAACRESSPSIALTTNANTPSPVRATSVELFEVRNQSSTPNIPAIVSTEAIAAVLARRDGIIAKLEAQEGSRVTKGQVLAAFDDDDSRLQLRQAELEVSRLQYEERQYEASVKINRSELERQQTLSKEGIVSQTEAEKAQFRLEMSQQELEKTRLATRQAMARVDALKLEVDKSLIRCPIDGVVTQRLARLGSNAVRNDKLFEVSQLSPLEVRFQIPQGDHWNPVKGETLQLVTSDARRITAVVSTSLPVADAGSSARTYIARLNQNPSLLPGAAVTVLAPASRGMNAISIPVSALVSGGPFQKGESREVFIVEHGKCAVRSLVLGKINGDRVEVISGLTFGDKVILGPPGELKPGMQVTGN